MPAPVASWVDDTFPTSKSLNVALYTADGTADNPNGIAFHAARPILFDTYTRTATFPGASGGTQTTMSTSGSVTTCQVVYDTAGYYGQYQDQPGGAGYYSFLAAVTGSVGDGQTPGGWTLLSHFAPLKPTATQTSVSADLTGTAQTPVSGTRQAPSGSLDSCPWFCDLVNVGQTTTWSPAVTIRDSAGTTTTNAVDTTDTSGETPRFYAVWAAVSASVMGQAVFSSAIESPYPWTAPAGVTSVTVSATGAGGGGGAGNVSGGGVEYGGGGAGGGEYAQGAVTVHQTTYSVIVGQGGTAGTTGVSSGNGGAGGNSVFAGDLTSVTAHGGSGGSGASTSADGSGGAGGTGSGATTHYNGGAGAAGTTAVDGGGGGSSAGTGQAGTTAMGAAGAPAPAGGGAGGQGGTVSISVVQSATGKATGSATVGLKLNFPAAIQAGNSVIVCVNYQGKPATQTGPQFPDPTVTLSDGTAVAGSISADNTNISTYMQSGMFYFFAVTGGQSGIVFTGHASTAQSDYRAVCLQMWEVTGLGPSPTVDAQASAETSSGGKGDSSSYPPTGTVNPTTADAPEFWAGFAAGQQNANFDINPPGSSQGWTCFPETGASHGSNTIYSQLLSGYQVQTTTGTMKFSGTYSKKVSVGWIVAAFTTSAVTTGSSPVIGPGGGGGAGLGSGNNGGNGFDGSVTLTWAGISGSGYGTPALPAPYSAWNAATTIGTTAGNTVNINGNTGIRDVLNFLSNPPAFRISTLAGQSISTSTLTAVTFSTVSPSLDSYTGWTGSTYTVQRTGLYLLHGLAAFAANSTGHRICGATINGTTYWGPPGNAASSGTTNVAKTQIFSLQAGDTVQFSVWQDSGGSLALATTDQSRFFLIWLGEEGTPASIWTPPDITFRWASGTPPSALPQLFQTHLGNDLGFLCTRPYLLAYQATAQTGLTVGSFSTVTLDTVGSAIHAADVGDNYTGWTTGASNKYTAQEPGWYLMAAEFFTAAAGAASATVTAGILPSTSGGVTPHTTPDYYQAATATTGATIGGGAAVLGLQYLRTGESVTPQVRGAGFASAYSTLAGTQNGGHYASHAEFIWISELPSVK